MNDIEMDLAIAQDELQEMKNLRNLLHELQSSITRGELVEVVRGEWKPIKEIFKYSKQWICSACGDPCLTDRHNFCPNCGANMKGEPDARVD